MPDFRLPDDAKTYTNLIFRRAIDLINCRIWEGIDIYRLQQWKNNFEGNKEQYFAACILDNFIYRSNRQTYSLIHQLFSYVLPNFLRLKIYYPYHDSCLNRLQYPKSFKDPKIRLVLALNPGDPLTKSSTEVARFMKRKFDINEDWIIAPEKIQDCIDYENIKYFIFIDDFIGSGQQFTDICSAYSLERFTDSFFIYAPLIAHTIGVNKVCEEYPNVSVIPVEKMTTENEVFHEDSKCFRDGFNTPKSAKNFYYELIDKYNIEKRNRRGYENMELSIAFEHAAPDNSLKVLWHNSDNWNSLVDR